MDDEELHSGDDVDLDEPMEDQMDYENGEEGREMVNIMDLSLGRAPAPVSSDGKVRRAEDCSSPLHVRMSVTNHSFNLSPFDPGLYHANPALSLS